MPLMVVLAKMELNGFGFSTEVYEKLKETLKRQASVLEAKARALAGRPFSISSPVDVAQVLYIELGLPPSGDPDTTVKLRQGRQMRRAKHLSTAKGLPYVCMHDLFLQALILLLLLSLSHILVLRMTELIIVRGRDCPLSKLGCY